MTPPPADPPRAKRHHSDRLGETGGVKGCNRLAGARSAALEADGLTQHHGKAVRQSVPTVASWRFDHSERIKIQIDNRLKRFRGRGLA
jgi:hypothetical protein